MSQLALLKAVRDQLRAAVVDGGLAYADGKCAVMFDGQPPPNAPDVFVAVHAGYWRAIEDENLHESYGVSVTVTIRTAYVGHSRQGDVLLIDADAGKRLHDHVEPIRANLHYSEAVRAAANATIDARAGQTKNGFVRPLRFLEAEPPAPRTADWFSAEQDSRSPPMGLSQTLHFGDAERVQVIEEQS